MELSQVLNSIPDIILQETFLTHLLNTINFRQFFTEIYNYPNIYESLSEKQLFWEQYFKRKYPHKYDQLLFKENINWFYQNILIVFTDNKEYYCCSMERLILTVLMPGFVSYPDNATISYNKNFKLYGNNILPIKNIKDIFFGNHGIGPILLENGNVFTGSLISILASPSNPLTIKFHNVNKILFIHYLNIYIVLANKGMVTYIVSNESIFSHLIPLFPEEIKGAKDIQLNDSGCVSIIDFSNDIYILLTSDFNFSFVSKPILKDIPVLSHSIYSKSEDNIPDYKYYIMLYVSLNGDLFISKASIVKLSDIIDLSIEQIKTPNDVKVKRVWLETCYIYGIPNTPQLVYLYQDQDNNIYNYNPDTKLSFKYSLPNNKHIEQFIIDTYKKNTRFLIIDEDGNLYVVPYKSPNFTGIIEVMESFNVPINESYPIGTKIISTQDDKTCLEVPDFGDDVLFPYDLYLLYVAKNLIEYDEVNENGILFRITNIPYLFKTFKK